MNMYYNITDGIIYKNIININSTAKLSFGDEKIINISKNNLNIYFEYQKFNIESCQYELDSENTNDFNIEIIFDGIITSDIIPFEDGGFILTPSESGKYLIKVTDGNLFSELEIEVFI